MNASLRLSMAWGYLHFRCANTSLGSLAKTLNATSSMHAFNIVQGSWPRAIKPRLNHHDGENAEHHDDDMAVVNHPASRHQMTHLSLANCAFELHSRGEFRAVTAIHPGQVEWLGLFSALDRAVWAWRPQSLSR